MEGTKERAKFFFEHKTTIYIKTRYQRFYRGLITELHEDHIILNDKMIGEMPLYFSEIVILEKNIEEGRI